jgi:diguanylate cyclase (GGDEF)-like protein/PAS domain S-box-containing protein
VKHLPDLNLNNCELEPIRYPGAVQPHGALLVVQAQTRLIEAASESCAAELGVAADSLLGQSLAQMFGAVGEQNLALALESGVGELVLLVHEGQRLSARCSANQSGQWLVNLERSDVDVPALRHLQYALRNEPGGLRALQQVGEIVQGAAQVVRRLTGFDRVMVYRFDAAWNGEVIGEACDAALDPYLGLHYPATDIPAQARLLFQQSRVRMIADTQYVPSALLARGDAHAIDLGRSSLRAVSPIHLECLSNMGARATLVGSLVVDGRLWGLVSCQHNSGPKYFGPGQRDALGWFCEDIAALVEATLTRLQRETAFDLSQRRRHLVEVIRAVHLKALMRHGALADLLDVVSADGFALIAERSIQAAGQASERSRIRELQQRRLAIGGDATLFVSHALHQDLGVDDVGDGVAGAVFVSLRDRPNVTLVWFRNERRQTVRRGGNPSAAHQADDSGRLSPRKSFQQFLQTISGQSLPWTADEVASSRELATLIEIEALCEREAFTQTILDSIPDSIVVLDDQGLIVSTNATGSRFAAQNGAPQLATGSPGLSCRNVCIAAQGQPDGDEANAAWAGIEAVQNRALDHFSIDYPCHSPQEQRWFQMSAYAMREPCEGVVVMHRDITLKKLALLRLEDERTQLRTLLQTIPDMVWVKDVQGAYTACNPQVERLFGARQANIVGRTDYDFLPAAQADDFVRRDRAVLAARAPQVFEEWVTYARDEGEALLETTRAPIFDGRGQLLGVLGVARDITDRHRLQQQTQRLALYEPVTRLPNRRLLNERLALSIAGCRSTQCRAALMFIDLDSFKPINDIHGHAVGDLLPEAVGRRLKSCVRDTDTAARFGGDEFVALLGELDTDPVLARHQAEVIAAKVLQALAAPYPLQAPPVELACTASVGVAVFSGKHRSAAEVLKCADEATYQAKQAGGNVVRFHEAAPAAGG